MKLTLLFLVVVIGLCISQSPQSEKLAESIKRIINNSSKARGTFASVFVVDYTRNQDVASILRVLCADNDVVIEGIDKSVDMFAKKSTRVDYLLVLRDQHDRSDFEKMKYFSGKELAQSTRIIVANFYANQQNYKSQFMGVASTIVQVLLDQSFFQLLIVHCYGDTVMRMTLTGYATNKLYFRVLPDDDNEFPQWTLPLNERKLLKVAYMDNFPFSRLIEGKIAGVEGKILDTFCEKYNWSYTVKTGPNNFREFSLTIAGSHVNMAMKIVHSQSNIEQVWLNKFDGMCLLMPRNVPVDAYQNLSFPFDSKVAVLLLATVIVIGCLWRIFKKLQNEDVSTLTIAFMMYQTLIGLSVQSSWSRKEVFLIFPFLFMQIILVGIYQSWIISFMISKPSMRSIESFTELNTSTQRVNFYFEELSLKLNEKLVVEMVSTYNWSMDMVLPDSFDRNLAYLVSCQFANHFVDTSRNFDVNRERLYDVLPTQITTSLQAYSTSEGFLSKHDFRTLIESLTESGIYEYWMKKATEENLKWKIPANEETKLIVLGDMAVPFQALLLGAIIGFLVLVFELIANNAVDIGRYVWRLNLKRRRGMPRGKKAKVHPFVL